jgi:DNA repair protein RecO (recombination protein O)
MRTLKVQGVIIQKREIGEKDYAITIFTPEFGKIFAYARGARNIKSKFQGHLDLLNICDFHIYQSPKNHIITDCCLVKNFNKFCCYLPKFYAVEEITKIIRTYTTENEESGEIYSLLTETLNSLENSKKENLILEAFKIKLFLLLGMMPDLNTNDFAPINIRMKKLMKYIIQNTYGEIQRINLCKNDARELERMTMLLSEQI